MGYDEAGDSYVNDQGVSYYTAEFKAKVALEALRRMEAAGHGRADGGVLGSVGSIGNGEND